MSAPGFRAERPRRSACPPPCRRARGFTLIELVVSVVLLGMLARTATLMWVDGFGLARIVNADTNGIADVRAVLERLSREIREVKYDGAAFCISTMNATQLVFNKTSGATYTATCGGASPTGTPLSNDFAVNIQRVGTNLNLGYAGNLAAPALTSTLTSTVCSTCTTPFAIRYLDAGYVVTASNSAVRFIELTLTVAPTGGQATQSRTVVALRNL